jgi:hypothetical protein
MNMSSKMPITYTASREGTEILRKSRRGEEGDSCNEGLHGDDEVCLFGEGRVERVEGDEVWFCCCLQDTLK